MTGQGGDRGAVCLCAGRYVYSGGERVFVHNRTSGVLGLFQGCPVLGDRSDVPGDSTGERMFVFRAFPLVRCHFSGVEFCER